MTKKVSAMQCGLFLCLTTISLKFLVFPSVIARYSFRDVYVPALVGLMLDFIFAIILLYVIKNNPHLTFKELLNRTIGKTATKVIIFLLFVHFFIKGVVIVKEIHNYFNETLFEDVAWLSFIIPLFCLLAYVMLKDFRTLGRTIQFFSVLIFIALIFTIIVPTTEAEFSNLLPIFENGFKGIINAVFHCGFVFGDYLVLLMLMGKVDYNKKTTKTIVGYLLFADVIVFLFFIIFSSIFGNLGLNHSLALSDVLMYTSINTATGTINWINIIVWLIILFLEAAIMFLCATKTLTEVFEFKSKYTPMFLILTMLFGAILYFYLNLIRIVQIVTSTPFAIYVITLQVLIPIICLISAFKLKGKNKIKLVNVYNSKIIKYQLTNICGVIVNKKYSSKKLVKG